MIAGVVVVTGALVGALVLAIRPHDARDARDVVVSGVGQRVSAEAGTGNACRRLSAYLDGEPSTYRPQCRALVGTDPGVRLRQVSAEAVHLAAERGTVHLTGVMVDTRGRRPLSADFTVSNERGTWKLNWDGTPIP